MPNSSNDNWIPIETVSKPIFRSAVDTSNNRDRFDFVAAKMVPKDGFDAFVLINTGYPSEPKPSDALTYDASFEEVLVDLGTREKDLF